MKINKYSFSLLYRVKSFIKEYINPFYRFLVSISLKKFNNEIKSDQKLFFEERPLFTHIEIETVNRCNNDCSFCPVNRHADIREYEKMEESLFEKIIDNLKDLQYDKDISFYSNNEPLLDDRIYDFIKYSKKSIPNARHILYSNGIMLNIKRYEKLFACGLDFLLIDNYSDDGKLIKSVQELYDYYLINENINSDKTEIVLRRKTETLSNRGGTSPNGKESKTLNLSCYLPFKQLVIRPSGKVSLCCYDSYGKTDMGDLNKLSIEELWYGGKHFGILSHLYKKGRDGISICEKCDAAASSKKVWGGIE